MAKYEDYVKKQETDTSGKTEVLDAELSSAQDVSQQRADDTVVTLPDDWKSKSLDNAFQDYSELQKSYSRQGNELGELRKTVDQLILLEDSARENPDTQESEKPVTMDDLYDDPDSNIRKVVREESSNQIRDTQEQLANLQKELAVNKFGDKHPDWKEKAVDPKFQNWVADSSYRQRLWASANSWDLDAADDLFSMYEDIAGATTAADKTRRDADISAATLETSGTTAIDSTETYSRRELMDYRLRSKRGDMVASNWLRENNPAITRAYAEGRVED